MGVPYESAHSLLFLFSNWGAKRVGKLIRVFGPEVRSHSLGSEWLSDADLLALTYTLARTSKKHQSPNSFLA